MYQVNPPLEVDAGDLRGDDALHLVRNKEVPTLLEAGKKGAPQPAVPRDADFQEQVDALVRASTNIFAGRAKPIRQSN